MPYHTWWGRDINIVSDGRNNPQRKQSANIMITIDVVFMFAISKQEQVK